MESANFPARVPLSDRKAVLKALASDGCVVVTDIGQVQDWRAKAAALPGAIFSDALLPNDVQVAGVHEEHAAIDAQAGSDANKLSGAPLLPHTDGYIYGNHLPDYIMLLVESQSAVGGENFVIDGKAVLRRLESHPHYSLLTSMSVDLSEKVASGGQVDGREAIGPLFQEVAPSNRLSWRRQLQTQAKDKFWGGKKTFEDVAPYQSLWAPLDNMDAAQSKTCKEVLELLDATVQQEAASAPRFKVSPGEVLLVDNWRMLHGREGFPMEQQESQTPRRLWRVWLWTKDSQGLPDGVGMTSTIRDADMVCGE
mmetsp:Transcript_35333/g.82548  ORF Transcript_35333/g.82548 Transcript_35333/m.82548 type:complete len:310 (+) Transcript_35333:100-1029(+)|eukprot:CAMPEP_0178405214 /NCGR_PEP_ID=MMETSP0689_2-20121128/18284_1 /TAXON_ID=160604 /ORGANISM="Amphidinium massartii, Strain CS-259" /LENGTH=309 /DNA_ID=CAMNT_0020026223 /DNA_START=98 /DNA_END=1027 /DNA_ORIENTATION=+